MKRIKDGKFFKAVQSFSETTQMFKKIDVSLLYQHTTLHHILNKGKMGLYLPTNLLIFLLCFVSKHSSIEIKPELQKNVLKFGYGINSKYEGMLAYSFDRFYVVTKFILPMMHDLKLSSIKYDKECNYLHNLDDKDNDQIKENMRDLLSYCAKIRPYMSFYKMQINAHNKTAHHTLKNEVDFILPKFCKGRKSKRGNFSAIISGFIGLAFEGILSFLHNRRHKALCKAISMMSIKTDIQKNKLMHLENTEVMHRVYNAEIIERLITLHSRKTMYENLFAGRISAAYEYYSQMHGKQGIQHYAIISMLYLRTIKDKYTEIYNEFISQLHIYAKAVRIWAKSYLLISLITPLKLQEILNLVKDTQTKNNPDHDIIIRRLHLFMI